MNRMFATPCLRPGWPVLVAAAVLFASFVAPAHADDTKWDGSQPPPGVYFHWYEPSFYTGFAPRTQDPDRIHLELGRGSQQRVTVVLGEEELDQYAGDLEARRRLYQELVDAKVLTLTTNKACETFEARLDEQGVAALVASKATTPAAEYRRRSLALLEALNPRRVFRIRIPLDRAAADWHRVLAAFEDGSAGAKTARLDAANAALPGRMNLSELPAPLDAALSRAIELARRAPAGAPEFRAETASFVREATSGRYVADGDAIVAVEFTAIYPAGTVDAFTTYQGERIPDVGVTGIWPLMRREQGRGQTGMVDYLSTNPGYGYIPLFAYQHAGGIAYNAFHNAGVRCELSKTPFLPPEWRKATSDRDGKPMQNLWIVGRGPTSHGCTRLPSGHMTELRHIAPTASEALVRVKNFRNRPECFDVFDLEGDGRAEAMGVQYYLAYRSDEHTPIRAYAPNRREPFYRWLYGSNIELGPVGEARLKSAPVCRFVGLRKAEVARVLEDVPLYEAAYEPESIQFYALKPAAVTSDAGFRFNRELRKVGHGHVTDRKLLFLD